MKTKLTIISIIIFAFGFYSFNKPEKKYHGLIGIWVYKSFDKDIIEYRKSDTFVHDEPGLEFKNKGKLKKRQNTHWCGTPPVVYRNYRGTWALTSDSTLKIKYKYWGGKAVEDLQIVELSESKLKLKLIKCSNN